MPHEERRLDGVLPLVLRVAGAPVEPPDQLDDVGVRARNLELLEGAPAELDHLALELLLDLLDGRLRVAWRALRPCFSSVRMARRAISRPNESCPSRRTDD